ncbi:hypothetical protein EDEG_00415 [Edhazardia aedis USNM 41457]|uniref:Peptidyl-prolyl cis-trans isomerase n=1 Tax=Edhazardia aedis (strain USNM 41457) TaxID=1003232 RepID=J8ZPG4_EDHAE|nr:hypothetical protein EDEG_00415 [Edhazardia aedis USNM 41457]|eukprot:EJW01563.1 hypothetical protein EDEG_00415 [Edhazardia aedis USNM 41457]
MAEQNSNKRVFLDIAADGEDLGRIVIELRFDVCPRTCQNFYDLCCAKTGDMYKGSPFHRVIPEFMMQGGDFTRRNGTGGRSIYGEKFNDENFVLRHNKPYVLSMANAGPNTNGSQFFITFNECSWLDGKHVVFGSVVEGTDVCKKVESLGSNSGRTIKNIIIKDCGCL